MQATPKWWTADMFIPEPYCCISWIGGSIFKITPNLHTGCCVAFYIPAILLGLLLPLTQLQEQLWWIMSTYRILFHSVANQNFSLSLPLWMETLQVLWPQWTGQTGKNNHPHFFGLKMPYIKGESISCTIKAWSKTEVPKAFPAESRLIFWIFLEKDQ